MDVYHNEPYNIIDDPKDFSVSMLTDMLTIGNQYQNKYNPD